MLFKFLLFNQGSVLACHVLVFYEDLFSRFGWTSRMYATNRFLLWVFVNIMVLWWSIKVITVRNRYFGSRVRILIISSNILFVAISWLAIILRRENRLMNSGDFGFIAQNGFYFILFAFDGFIDTWLISIRTFPVEALIIFSLLTFELCIWHENIPSFTVFRHWTCQINFIFKSVRYIFCLEYCFRIIGVLIVVIVSGSGPSFWWLGDFKLSVNLTISYSNAGCTRLIFATRMVCCFPNGLHHTYLSVHWDVVVGGICFPLTVILSNSCIEMAIHSFSTGLETLINYDFVVFIELIDSTIAHKSLCTVQTCLNYATHIGMFLKWN